jgi:hypothetical protein
MARKLKTYQASLGFFDLAIAARLKSFRISSMAFADLFETIRLTRPG